MTDPTLPLPPNSADDVTLAPSPAPDAGAAPTAVAGYEILGELGRGGMGVVYQARQIGLDRLVALKMILAGGHAGAAEVSRFRAEAAALARLRHPNIVQVYDVGEQDGHPYFSLEYLDGGSLAQHLDGTPLPSSLAARLVETLARAVHAAHREGIVHRDLKPANVLLSFSREPLASAAGALARGSRLNEAVPKITDFGLAKRLDGGQGQTQSGSILGTPSYMAPEQAAGRTRDIGPAADTYALGAILYECLTGRPPFRAETPLDTILQVVADEPVPPRRLNPKVPRDLETICLRCLRKEPAKRYATAEALADDLNAFLAGRPIAARPAGRVERAWRWCRRNPRLAAVGGVAGMLALVILVGAPWYSLRLTGLNADLEATRYTTSIGLAHREWQESNVNRARGLLESLPPGRRDTWEYRYLDGLLQSHLFDLRTNLTLAREVAFGADGTTLAVAHSNGTVHIHDLAASGYRELTGLEAVAFAPALDLLAAAGPEGSVRLLDARTGQAVRQLRGHTGTVVSLSFSGDGSRLASLGSDGLLKLWDVTRGVARGEVRVAGERVALSPDGQLAAVVLPGFGVQVWEPAAGRQLPPPQTPDHAGGGHLVAWAPDGKVLATAHLDSSIRLWDAQTGRELRTLYGHRTGVFQLSFSPDGRHLASVGGTQSVVLWDTVTGRELRRYRGHFDVVQCCAFSPDGARLATADSRGIVKVWDATASQDVTSLHPAPHATNVTFSPDSRSVAVSGADGVRIWNLPPDGQPVHLLGGAMLDVAFHPDGRRLALAGSGGDVHVADAAERQWLPKLGGHTAMVLAVTWSPDGQLLASAAADGTVLLRDGATGEERHRLRVAMRQTLPPGVRRWLYLRFSPDGRRLAVGASTDQDGRAWAFDVATGRQIGPELVIPWLVSYVGFSPDGSRLRVANQGEFEGGELRPGKLLERPLPDGTVTTRRFAGQMYGNFTVAVNPDGSRFASIDEAGSVRLWDFATGRELLALTGPRERGWIAFSPDGTRLAAVTQGGGSYATVYVWDAATRTPEERRAAAQARTGPWHREQALAEREAALWPPVLYHLRHVERAGNMDRPLWIAKAQALASLRRWKEAIAAGDEAIAAPGDATERDWLRHRFALLRLADGDLDGYRRTCAESLAKFKADPAWPRADELATLAACGPAAVADYAALLEVSRKAVPEQGGETLLLRHGALLLRAGQVAESLQFLNKAIVRVPEGQREQMFLIDLYVALASVRAGKVEQARAALSRGGTALERQAASGATLGTQLNDPKWLRVLVGLSVRREVEAELPKP